MSREIKFRVWENKNNNWVQESLSEDFLLKQDGRLYIDFCGDIDPIHDTKKIVYQQFTGLLDSEGEEVYEGDILSFKGYFNGNESYKPLIGVVEWSEYDASFRINEYKNGPSWDFHTFCELKEVNEFYVEGNIFENPELLK